MSSYKFAHQGSDKTIDSDLEAANEGDLSPSSTEVTEEAVQHDSSGVSNTIKDGDTVE